MLTEIVSEYRIWEIVRFFYSDLYAVQGQKRLIDRYYVIVQSLMVYIAVIVQFFFTIIFTRFFFLFSLYSICPDVNYPFELI